MPYSPLIILWHTHTDATVYTTLKLTLLSHSTPSPISHHQYQMHSHHYARHLPQRSIPCAIYP
ncbi:ADM_HP2_G0025380.mRNA.1.CDS.1 [Saccharomyces cerevisiae]|nr:ADM_HP2_G0025380.mRNA.1.CDS.1 [Saccharomyces cerevisiae]CAI6443957.1 ADM_HP2_G0025380.mRNA.1.CDS.1 [Saccharomyces cerevisiae]CAI6558889.1 ASN_HP1_G0015790.mRNA.1.CDS.1 [Saccharomyces cerevisiae]